MPVSELEQSVTEIRNYVYCGEQRRLLHMFAEAVDQLLLLHQNRFTAVMDGDSDSDWLMPLIERAKEKKEGVKQAYMEHARRHGCASV